MTVDYSGPDKRLDERRRIEEALLVTRDALLEWIGSANIGGGPNSKLRRSLKGHDPGEVLLYLLKQTDDTERVLGSGQRTAFNMRLDLAWEIRNAWAHFDQQKFQELGGYVRCLNELLMLVDVSKSPQASEQIRELVRQATTGQKKEAIQGGPPVTLGPVVATPNSPTLGRIVVDWQGEGDYLTIGEAISKASPETRVLVKSGVYREALSIGQDIEIAGDGNRSDVVVEAIGEDAITINTNRAVLRGLTVRVLPSPGKASKLDDDDWVAIVVLRGVSEITNCDVSSEAGTCVDIHEDANPSIRDCQIRDGKGPGVYVYEQGQGTIERCVISGNAKAGVWISKGGNPTVRGCEIRDGWEPGGARLRGP